MNTKEQRQNQYPYLLVGYKFVSVFVDGDFYDVQHFKTLKEAKWHNHNHFDGNGEAMSVEKALRKYEFFYNVAI